jgi:hypothetical protein
MRAVMSVALPGVKPTTTRTGLLGYAVSVCAHALFDNTHASATSPR